jgi:DNA-binding GntR family transcriptional regulator
MSIPVIRRAVGQLEADGLLEGHPGKAVYVKATPADLGRERQDMEALGEQFRALQSDVQELARQAETASPSDLVQGLTELRETVGRIEANLIDLYQKTGHAYPQGGSNDTTKPAARHGRSKR